MSDSGWCRYSRDDTIDNNNIIETHTICLSAPVLLVTAPSRCAAIIINEPVHSCTILQQTGMLPAGEGTQQPLITIPGHMPGHSAEHSEASRLNGPPVEPPALG